MLATLLRPLGRALENWKWVTGRKIRGLWLGAPPVLLNKQGLLPGDVLFCADTSNKKRANVIRVASAGGYVHCALYVGASQVVDVVPKGIRQLSLHDFVRQYSYIAVARCPGNATNRTRRKKLSNYARAALRGSVKGYSGFSAALAPLKELSDLRNLNRLWMRPWRESNNRRASKRMFCSEFIVEAYIACGYIERDDPYRIATRRTPTGLAEENIFELIGYICTSGWSGISADDHFLGGCGWVLTEEGRKRLQRQEQERMSFVRRMSS